MRVKVKGSGRRRSRERVFAVQDRDADVVEGFADLEDVWFDVGAVALMCGDGIRLEGQGDG